MTRPAPVLSYLVVILVLDALFLALLVLDTLVRELVLAPLGSVLLAKVLAPHPPRA